MNRDVRLRIEGSLLERLLEKALRRGAQFASVQRTSRRSITVACDEASASTLRSLCEKYGLNVRELDRSGLTALMETLRRRWTLLPGALLCALICFGFLTRIWLVDVSFTGPRSALGDEAAIRACLRESGVRSGMAASQIDTGLLQKRLLSEAGDYSYVGVRRQGVRLLVEAAPEVPAPEVYEIESARSLYAARDGVVESVEVRSGTACVKPGDTVRRGQLLIRGAETVGKDSETGEDVTAPVAALGEVLARCWYEGEAQGALSSEGSRRTGNSRAAVRLKLLNLSLPLTDCEGYPREEVETEILPVVGLFLPLEIERSIHWETQAQTIPADRAVLEENLAALARADALAKLSGDNIQYQAASAWTDASQIADALRIRAVYEIYTDIAVTHEEVY